MAAVSYHRPTRSYLQQTPRYYDEEPPHPQAFSYRRRQFIERCHDARSNQYRDPIPTEVSVKKTREELSKNASQSAAVNRRLNVDSGWSKVEEVRKKFEGAAAAASYSRSFESPPRRRLADSLFASFKLPRKKDPNMSAPRSLAPQQPKRKSAVELLAETKAFYVKSETVRDRKQELPLRVSSGLSQAIAAGGCHLVSSGTLNNDACCNPYATTARAGFNGSRRTVSAGDGLQNTLRRLLEHSDSRENVYAVPHKTYERRSKDNYERTHTSGTVSGTSSSGTSGGKARSSPDTKLNRPRSFGDARVFFPESFIVPRTRDVINACSIPSPQSSGESAVGMCAELPTISPPPQYAHYYTRSNSHSQPSVHEEDASLNINSHKSLPDLHTQTRCYTEHVTVCGEPVGRSPRRRRHSTHQRTASCSSKGTRSNHSSLMSSSEAFSEHPSPGEETYPYNRCGWSMARDSGGSSGHYTQRSGGGAQARGHLDKPLSPGCTYGSGAEGAVVSAPAQFQDGAAPPPPPRAPHTPPHAHVTIHFQASAPPPQFQDSPPSYDKYEYPPPPPAKCGNVAYERREYTRFHSEAGPELISKQPQFSRPRPEDAQDYVNAQQLHSPEELSPPGGTFKRQRCLRYKQTRPRPILRSKSDISDRYRRPEGRSPASAPCEDLDSPESSSPTSDRLAQFFDSLGLEPRSLDALLHSPPPDTPVYFSSCTSLDSNHPATYAVQDPLQKQIYRNTEPPSVVERNARIVKWLCQCRKLQQTTPH